MKGGKALWRYFPIVLAVVELGAWRRWVHVTTVDLASKTGLPQQTVSRALRALESEGFIEKQREGRRFRLRVTGRCLNALRPIYERLIPVFEEVRVSRFSGIVTRGLGDGEHYVRVYADKLERLLGFKPYFGTLNLRIVNREDMKTLFTIRGMPAFRIESFRAGGRIYGAVKCYKAIIEDVVKGAVIIPERTHYGPDIVELIAPESLRERLNLKDGDKVSVEVRVDLDQTDTG